MQTTTDILRHVSPEKHTQIIECPSSRELLEQTYVDAAVNYVNEATDTYHTFDNDDVRDPRFNMHYTTNMFARFRSLAERENSEARNVMSSLTLQYEQVLLAQLGLLAGREVLHRDLQIERGELTPSVIYRDVLQTAGVFVQGVHTEQLSHEDLTVLHTQSGDRFAEHFLVFGQVTPEDTTSLSQSMRNLQLVA